MFSPLDFGFGVSGIVGVRLSVLAAVAAAGIWRKLAEGIATARQGPGGSRAGGLSLVGLRDLGLWGITAKVFRFLNLLL